MKETLRVGILGAGGAGEGHAIAFSQLPGVAVTALWSRTRERAETLAAKLNVPQLQVFDDWQTLIEQADVDIISLATPPTLRKEPFSMAVAQNCHVMVEKPFSNGLADAKAMVQLAQKSDTVTATCFNWRYSPGSQVAWRQVQEERIGRILDIHMEWRFRALSSGFFARRPWAARFDVGDGPLAEAGSHQFDRARFLTGSEFVKLVSSVRSFTLPESPTFTIDGGCGVHIAEMSNGVLGDLRFTLTAGQGDWYLVLNGEKGTLKVTHEAVVRQCSDENEPVELEIPESDQVPEAVGLGQHVWNRLIADFVLAIRRGDISHDSVPHLPTILDGLRCQQVIVAARLSEEERRWVEIAELE